MLSELESIREQVFQYLLQTLRVGNQAAGEVWIGVNVEVELAIFRLVAERTSDGIEHAAQENFLGFD